MAILDITEKILEDYNDVFADIANVLLFQGEQRILPEHLVNTKDKSMIKADGRIHEQERDVNKYWNDGNVTIALYGIENQTDIDKDMPLRVYSYDGASYKQTTVKWQRPVSRHHYGFIFWHKKMEQAQNLV